MSFTTVELERYSRQILLPEVGADGQARLAQSRVLLVGAGGLGSPAALYLAAAGIGHVGIVEYDAVDRSNLHRQVLFGEADVGRSKLDVAVARLQDANPHITLQSHATRLEPHNAREMIGAYDAVVDGSDTFATKYLVNDACVLEGVPDVYASVLRFEGELSVMGVAGGPCYRCLYPEPPAPGDVPSCAEAGVLGAIPGVLGTLQAAEVIKLLLGIGEPLIGRLLRYDALTGSFRTFAFARDPECAVCGDQPRQRDVLPDYETFCARPVTTITPSPMAIPEITATELKQRIDNGENPLILDVRRHDEYDLANIDGRLIPLDELPERVEELDPHRTDDLIVVHCRSGGRSAKAVEILQRHGFDNAVNLKGGIRAWSDEVDPTVPKY